ncbi:hypothetical protein LY76DRAFT_599648, partial [Colletotrichum caudatum]
IQKLAAWAGLVPLLLSHLSLTTPDFAVINREFNSLSFTERRAIGFKSKPEFASRLESPCLEDLLYYANVIKAAAKAIKATDKYNRIAANCL